jgi:fatty acid desaturase
MDNSASTYKISPTHLRELYQHVWYHNLKIPLSYSMLIGCGYVAWNTSSPLVEWLMYGAMGYLWMSIVTFMHDCTHSVLFKARWKNWAFGVFSTLPIIITFIAFKEDHLEHHRYNRTTKDPDAFTMGKRTFADFLLFYAYVLIGGVLTILQFLLLYPLQKFRGEKLIIHCAELALRVVVYTGLILWTVELGVLDRFLKLWLVPGYIFSLLNSVRFIAEHYDTPWEAGQLKGTRTIVSNQVNSFFWNNINYHIGHHVYPGVPWYNLQKLHAAMQPEIEHQRATVDSSYFRVFLTACCAGPESVERNAERIALRASQGSLGQVSDKSWANHKPVSN